MKTKVREKMYIENVVNSICEKYNYLKSYNNELSDKYYSYDNNCFSIYNLDNIELISISFQLFNLLKFSDILVKLKKVDDKLKDVLDLLEINYIEDNTLNNDFIITNNDNILGTANDNLFLFNIDNVLNLMHDDEIFISTSNKIDVYVDYDKDDEKDTVLFLVQNLRLNGFITDYNDNDLKINSTFIVTVRDNYEVKVLDKNINEESIININDLVEYLDMNI